MLRTLIALSLLILAAPQQPASQTRTIADRIAAIEGAQAAEGTQGLGKLTIEELMKRFNVPGVSVAVIHDFNIHWAKGYGIADVETGAAVNPETMFQAASISKPVAAMAVLRAVQDGLFTLDDDINSMLTSWKLEGGEFTKDRPVTPRTLTSHTSGLGDGFGFPGYEPSATRPTVVQILAGHSSSNVGKLFMERPPMSLMEYSGGGVTLMQQALSDARKRPFAEIMRDQVLRPIGMERSSFEQPISPEHDRNAARAHSRDGKSKGAKWHVYPEQAAAGLWTTPSDLARFAIEVQKSAVGTSNRVLSRTTVQEMLSPVGVGDYAVGFSIQKMGQGWYFQHGGSNWGFQATLLAHKVKGYGLAIMTNGDQGGAILGELSRRIQAAYEWDSLAQPAPRGYRPPPPARPEVAVAEAILKTYVGEYQLSTEMTLAITFEGGRLHVQPTGQPKLPLVGESETTFFVREANVRISFTKEPSGAVTGLVLDQGGREQPAKRTRQHRIIPLQPMSEDVEVLYGDPNVAGEPFVIGIRELAGGTIPPHRHPVDEHITVLQGTLYFGVGEKFDRAAMKELKAGGYAFIPKGSTMFGYTPEAAIVQVSGVGPFNIQWRAGTTWRDSLKTLDDPDAARVFKFKKGERVVAKRGTGRIRQGYDSGEFIGYEIERADGSLFMAEEGELRRAGRPR